jgi:homoserine dehydrogenase
VDIVIELVGGTGIARTMVLAALKLGKPVVTANKALLSAHGEELFAAAKNTARIFITRPASAAAFPSSNRCAKALSATASTRSTASSTAPAITSSPG